MQKYQQTLCHEGFPESKKSSREPFLFYEIEKQIIEVKAKNVSMRVPMKFPDKFPKNQGTFEREK
ncbi:MAG: hypothetical protein A2275_04985 [Bacteroidetes bacterium RIFOXYA12_FULL_35_11]|nr:MAG: hypothetical protein A2X01_14755 [Bacteroidetes bacterium GWF2_35_48]OFY75940.1 MAG: hypothetical protein A2275_04985 [Bacteroidetes bacterium RIFOXYA12_FULL_35_11]OFY92478.1 MAG: hypothetical protein A2491_10715 [Bacteroidetes bacterium RIFOXYC12_FULL_35_7]OFY96004.1 MAG: hypothetical protein A2309_02530 [Bacteroidetes bacterium RIFOXYB2_FULL_35_7]HBX51547.1 hypothetical protein [Bacteroidales bacterium]